MGPASTRYAWAYGFDVGGGVEWDIAEAPGFAIGPYLRYAPVIDPDSRPAHRRARMGLGGSFTYHFGRAAANATPQRRATAHGRRLHTRSACPTRTATASATIVDRAATCPQGKHPDSFKPGCPENDEDGDDVPDVDDPCPVTAPGAKPDPKRPGCPLVDSDKDGVPDHEDACPSKAGPATADPTHSGCPSEKKRAAAPEEAAPPAESPDAPQTVKKRRAK